MFLNLKNISSVTALRLIYTYNLEVGRGVYDEQIMQQLKARGSLGSDVSFKLSMKDVQLGIYYNFKFNSPDKFYELHL